MEDDLILKAIEIAFQAGYGRKSNEEEYLEMMSICHRRREYFLRSLGDCPYVLAANAFGWEHEIITLFVPWSKLEVLASRNPVQRGSFFDARSFTKRVSKRKQGNAGKSGSRSDRSLRAFHWGRKQSFSSTP